jgi:hypothetical protein
MSSRDVRIVCPRPYCAHKCPLLLSIPTHTYPTYISYFTSFSGILILLDHLRKGLRSGLFRSIFPREHYLFLLFPVRETCPVTLIILGFFAPIITWWAAQVCVNKIWADIVDSFLMTKDRDRRSQHRLRHGSAAANLLGLRVRVSPMAWISVTCECCVLSDRGL